METINNFSNSNDLPIMRYRNDIIQAVKENQFVIVVGGPGCGKTTQIPQFLYSEDLHENEIIGITQPRRIAAVNMAKRVAKEMHTAIGRLVGYEIRFQKECNGGSKIKYMTDGILLNESIRDKMLNDYRIIMIDEAHERSVNTDMLLALLRVTAKRRSEFKVIISSATLDDGKFLQYFNTAKVVNIDSNRYPVEIKYYDSCSDYIQAAVEIVMDIHRANQKDEEQNDILIFLTGEEDINMTFEKLSNVEGLVLIALYSAIDFESQNKVFEPVKPHETKVVIATNIAETSLTIDGITHVIDCGYVKQIHYKYHRRMDELQDVKISMSQANQRAGRAGRTKPGVCHRLYLECQYNSFNKETEPEIFRTNLFEISLILAAIKSRNVEFIDCPDQNIMLHAEKELRDHKFVDLSGKLTRLGGSVIKLPIDPVLGKVLLVSSKYNVTSHVLRIVAMFSEEMRNIFRIPFGMAKKAELKWDQFRDEVGDHFAVLKVYDTWKKQKDRTKWCQRNFIDNATMEMVDNTVDQIQQILNRGNLNVDDDETNFSIENIQKCFVIGYFKNICIHQRKDAYCRVIDGQLIYLHSHSSFKKLQPKIILYHEVMKCKRILANGVMQLNEDFLRKNFPNTLEMINFPVDIDIENSF